MRFEFNDDSQKICNSVDVVNYGIQCDICGNKVLSVSNINGKRYCAGCYYKTFMKDNQKAEIDQLKQQLAEKQNTIDEINKEFVQAIHDWKTLCAEKDKEIEKLKQQYTILENENGKLTTELIMGKYKKAQKEVSFGMQLAIQELEKVKNKCNGMYELWLYSNHKENMYNNEDIAGVFEDISVFTNDLIKKLKGE